MKNTMKLFKISVISIAVTTAVSALAQESDASNTTTEVITVTGKIASLSRSLGEKRLSSNLVDAISSEELGKFPDANVADSLAHIPGITISRVHGGEGQKVTVRGLGPDYNIVTLNGRLLATDDDGRNFAFDVLPSEMISGATVMKSVEASMLEGSIGGSVDLRSARPFDYDGYNAFVAVEGEHNDMSDENGFKISGVVSNQFYNDTMGALLGVSYSDATVRSDGLGEFFMNSGWPETIRGEDASDIFSPCCYSVGTWLEDKQRIGVNGSFQWQPNDDLSMTFDGLFTRLDSPAKSYHEAFYVEAIDDAANWSDIVYDGNIITGMTVSDLVPELVTRNEHRVVDTMQVGWNTKYNLNNDLVITADAYFSNSTRDSGGKDSWVVAGALGQNGGHTGYFSLNENGLPNITMDLDDGRELGELTNDDFGPHVSELSGTDVDDQIVGLSLNAKQFFDHEYLVSLDYGVSYIDRQKSRSTVDNILTDGANTLNGYPFTFGQLGEQVLENLPVDNFMNGVNGQFPRDFLVFDVDKYFDAISKIDGKTVNGIYYPEGTYASMLPVYNPVKSYDIEEETVSAFIQANFEGVNWFANAGLRVVRTDTSAQSAVNEILSIVANPGGATAGYSVTYSDATPISEKGDYTEILPSVNVGYNLTDELLLRVAVAKSIARPSLDQLAPITEDYAYDGDFSMYISGNPNLSPVKSTQADIGLEWYFSESSALTGAIFYKDITDFITYKSNYDVPIAGQDFYVESPVNGDSADVKGVEIGLQQFFENGFGILANYTYTDTAAYVDGEDQGGLEGVPQEAYSLSLIYEKNGISAQVSADYTGEYTAALFSSLPGVEETGEESTWVTASISYDISDNTNIFLKGDNLTDEVKRSYLGREDIPRSYEMWGRTYMLGFRHSF